MKYVLLAVLFLMCACAPKPNDREAYDLADRATNCSLGFRELFHFAKGRPWTPEEGAAFAALSQSDRNEAVKALAREANGRAALDRAQGRTSELGSRSIRTEDRLGTDGVTYTAVWVEGR